MHHHHHHHITAARGIRSIAARSLHFSTTNAIGKRANEIDAMRNRSVWKKGRNSFALSAIVLMRAKNESAMPSPLSSRLVRLQRFVFLRSASDRTRLRSVLRSFVLSARLTLISFQFESLGDETTGSDFRCALAAHSVALTQRPFILMMLIGKQLNVHATHATRAERPSAGDAALVQRNHLYK